MIPSVIDPWWTGAHRERSDHYGPQAVITSSSCFMASEHLLVQASGDYFGECAVPADCVARWASAALFQRVGRLPQMVAPGVRAQDSCLLRP